MDVWKVNQNSEECWHHFEEMGDTSRFLGFYVNQLWSWLFIWNWDVHFYDPNRNEQNDSRGHSTKKWDQVRQIQPSNVGHSSDSGNRSVETKELQRVNRLGWVGDSGGWNQFLLLSEFTNEDRSGVQNHGFSTTSMYVYPSVHSFIFQPFPSAEPDLTAAGYETSHFDPGGREQTASGACTWWELVHS